MVHLIIEDRNGTRQDVEVPEEINLSLMEVLKAAEYHILATCGGMALCATCHVEVLEGGNALPPLNDQEMDMLDTLPDATSRSRLACQLRIGKNMEGAVFKIRGQEEE